MVYTQQIDGVLVVDKPSGPTSHAVVARVRKLLHTKTGHLGTLDPAATGVLPLVLGRATRLARFMQLADKEYLATIRLGRATDTYDGDGRTVSERPVPEITPDRIDQLLSQFQGEVSQIPPMFSAVKVAGERLYRAARRGETRERPKRTVSIFRLELVDKRTESWDLRIHCSSGTYIRTVAHDIGELLGCGAHLEKLRRTRSGNYDLSLAVQLEKVGDSWQRALLPIDKLLPDLPAVPVNSVLTEMILHGNPVEHEGTVEGEYCRLIHENLLIAIGRVEGPLIQPKVVLRTATQTAEGRPFYH
jgi:tRNA pseudouridine55 synthase